MELNSMGGEAEVAEDMAKAIEEEDLDAAKPVTLGHLGEAKPASLAELDGQARRRQRLH
jgi:hypothetical protein